MRVALVIALALAVLAPGALAATPRASFNDVEDEVMCDTCNVPLNIAESPRADQERAGHPPADRAGPHEGRDQGASSRPGTGRGILATPADSGFSLAVWVAPVVVVGVVVALGLALVPRWRRRGPGGGVRAGPELSAADRRRLDEDLARYDL